MKRVVWVVERHNDEGEWLPRFAVASSKKEARSECRRLNEKWHRLYRIRKYVPEEER